MYFKFRTMALYVLVLFTAFVPLSSSALTTTPSGSFELSKGNNTSIDFTFTIQSDPGDKSYVFWAQQFYLENGSLGYLGMQRVAGTKKIIFSIWDTTASVATMPGAIAEPFGGEGVGQHVIAPLDWQLGHTYRFRLANAGGTGPWWGVTVTDLSNNASWSLGRIQSRPGWGNLQPQVTTFTEVYIGGQNCENIPYARASFGAPSSDNGQGKTISVTPKTYGDFTNRCSLVNLSGARDGVNVGTRSDAIGNSLIHQIGLSNGPQNWDDYDRQGKVGAIYKYANRYSNRTEYFRLISVGGDRRYGYFPTNATSNSQWQYLGTTEPFYNGATTAKVWGENNRKANIGDLFAYPISPGITWYFKLSKLTGDQQYWYFPTTQTNNANWQYVGANIGK